MTTKHFSELFTLLRNNPLRFLKIYFTSNMDAEEIDSWDPDSNEEDKKISLELDLYDGVNFIGSFKFAWNDIEELTLETEDERGTVFSVSGMKENIGSKKKLGIRLDFPLPINRASGECYIYEYEDDDEEEEEIATTHTQKATPSLVLHDDEEEREKRKHKLMTRIGLFIFISASIVLVGSLLSKLYPEVINEVVNLFR